MSTHEKQATVFEKIFRRKWAFLGLFTFVYFLTLVGLGLVGLAPWSGDTIGTIDVVQMDDEVEPADDEEEPDTAPTTVAVRDGELPLRIEIPKLGLRTSVTTPSSTSIAALDAALLQGAVRYPGSGVPGEKGNVVIFGHSSHLPVVYNQAFRAFNDIQNLEEGDQIFVIGKEKIYIYTVDDVEEATTASDAIPLHVSGAKLTLATCNNFGSKEDRFIVSATLTKVQDVPDA